jgi:uncharacterized integral membrane protein
MAYVKRFLLLALAALLVVFVFQNQHLLSQPETLSFFRYSATLWLGFWLVLAFLTGVFLFLVVDLPRSFSLKREISRKAGELARAQFELGHAQAFIAQAQAQVQAASPGLRSSPVPAGDLSRPPVGDLARPPVGDLARPPVGDLEKRLGL